MSKKSNEAIIAAKKRVKGLRSLQGYWGQRPQGLKSFDLKSLDLIFTAT
ncbi:MAG: hypothetical protein FWC89_11650 [Defluviitaleaceae bacterium]|nr:hypothetical protein [Defluviitaleaceae bacterium]